MSISYSQAAAIQAAIQVNRSVWKQWKIRWGDERMSVKTGAFWLKFTSMNFGCFPPAMDGDFFFFSIISDGLWTSGPNYSFLVIFSRSEVYSNNLSSSRVWINTVLNTSNVNFVLLLNYTQIPYHTKHLSPRIMYETQFKRMHSCYLTRSLSFPISNKAERGSVATLCG